MGGAGCWALESAAIRHSVLLTRKLYIALIAKLHLSFNQSTVLYNFLMHDTSEHFPARATNTPKLILKGKNREKQTSKRMKPKILAQ